MPRPLRRLLLRLARALALQATTAPARENLAAVFGVLDPRLRAEVRLDQPSYPIEDLMRSALFAVTHEAAREEDIEALSLLFDPRKILGR